MVQVRQGSCLSRSGRKVLGWVDNRYNRYNREWIIDR